LIEVARGCCTTRSHRCSALATSAMA